MAQPRLEKRQLWLMVTGIGERFPESYLSHISTTDAKVEALFLPAAAEANATRQAAVIFAHGAICLLARDRPLHALILQSTFTSLDALAASHCTPGFLLRDHFDKLSAAKSFPGRMLVIHGRDDRLIPWNEGLRLAGASGHATFRLYDCGHGSVACRSGVM